MSPPEFPPFLASPRAETSGSVANASAYARVGSLIYFFFPEKKQKKTSSPFCFGNGC